MRKKDDKKNLGFRLFFLKGHYQHFDYELCQFKILELS